MNIHRDIHENVPQKNIHKNTLKNTHKNNHKNIPHMNTQKNTHCTRMLRQRLPSKFRANTGFRLEFLLLRDIEYSKKKKKCNRFRIFRKLREMLFEMLLEKNIFKILLWNTHAIESKP